MSAALNCAMFSPALLYASLAFPIQILLSISQPHTLRQPTRSCVFPAASWRDEGAPRRVFLFCFSPFLTETRMLGVAQFSFLPDAFCLLAVSSSPLSL
jgi:hypothetical protein